MSNWTDSAVKSKENNFMKTSVWLAIKLCLLIVFYLKTKSYSLIADYNSPIYLFIIISAAFVLILEYCYHALPVFLQQQSPKKKRQKDLLRPTQSGAMILLPRLAVVIVMIIWNYTYFSVYQRDNAFSWSMKKAATGYFMDSAAFSLGEWENTSGQFYAFLSDYLSENELILTPDSYNTPHLSYLRSFKVVNIHYTVSDLLYQPISIGMFELIKHDFQYMEYHTGTDGEYKYLFVLNNLERRNTQIIALTSSDDVNLVIFIPLLDYQNLNKVGG